jgi:hypothetical protein
MKTIVCTLLTDAVAFPTGYDMPDDKRWIVTTSSRRPLADIAKELMDAGFSIDSMERLGRITGQATEEALARLQQISGVVDVTLQPEDAAPSDSEMW